MNTITLKLTCTDKQGLIANITSFIFNHKGNIVNLDQHTDTENKVFFMRVEWEKNNFTIPLERLQTSLNDFFIAKEITGQWEIFDTANLLNMAIFVSKYDHCLYDLLLRYKSGEIKCHIPLIISNHNDLHLIAENFEIDFYHIPIENKNKLNFEEEALGLLEKYKINFIVLARYMQIITEKLIDNYPNKIINIHHSFLPAFKGAKPYHQAYEKGVKIIGATSHFVTAELDQGPIIAQDVIPVTHKDNIHSLVIKGRDIERRVLAGAVKNFIEHRIFIMGNRTIIL